MLNRIGFFVTKRPQAFVSALFFSFFLFDFGIIRFPAIDNTAGTSVTDANTAISTLSAAVNPMADMNGMPTTVNPQSATITVSPAKTTALPAVPAALAIDSFFVHLRPKTDDAS